jgi:hypothetical protein
MGVNMGQCKGLASKILALYKGGMTNFKEIQANPDVLSLGKQVAVTDKQIRTVLSNNSIDPVESSIAAIPGKGLVYSFIF